LRGVLGAQAAWAQSNPTYVQFENFTVKGVLYQPDSGAPRVAVLLIHRVNNYLGHSGGGPTLSFYQAVAEKGVAFCNMPSKITVCGKELGTLPSADGLILADASLGNPVALLRSLNPAANATFEQGPVC
jgi:hypothetical protein